jgi:hypothetical protein
VKIAQDKPATTGEPKSIPQRLFTTLMVVILKAITNRLACRHATGH